MFPKFSKTGYYNNYTINYILFGCLQISILEFDLLDLRYFQFVLKHFGQDDKKILEFIMDTKWEGNLRGHKVWECLKVKHFLLIPRIHWNDLKLRAQKLLRPKRELRAWIALTGLKRSRWIDETRPEWPSFNISMRYLRYYLLNKGDKGRLNTPYDIEENPELFFIDKYTNRTPDGAQPDPDGADVLRGAAPALRRPHVQRRRPRGRRHEAHQSHARSQSAPAAPASSPVRRRQASKARPAHAQSTEQHHSQLAGHVQDRLARVREAAAVAGHHGGQSQRAERGRHQHQHAHLADVQLREQVLGDGGAGALRARLRGRPRGAASQRQLAGDGRHARRDLHEPRAARLGAEHRVVVAAGRWLVGHQRLRQQRPGRVDQGRAPDRAERELVAARVAHRHGEPGEDQARAQEAEESRGRVQVSQTQARAHIQARGARQGVEGREHGAERGPAQAPGDGEQAEGASDLASALGLPPADAQRRHRRSRPTGTAGHGRLRLGARGGGRRRRRRRLSAPHRAIYTEARGAGGATRGYQLTGCCCESRYHDDGDNGAAATTTTACRARACCRLYHIQLTSFLSLTSVAIFSIRRRAHFVQFAEQYSVLTHTHTHTHLPNTRSRAPLLLEEENDTSLPYILRLLCFEPMKYYGSRDARRCNSCRRCAYIGESRSNYLSVWKNKTPRRAASRARVSLHRLLLIQIKAKKKKTISASIVATAKVARRFAQKCHPACVYDVYMYRKKCARTRAYDAERDALECFNAQRFSMPSPRISVASVYPTLRSPPPPPRRACLDNYYIMHNIKRSSRVVPLYTLPSRQFRRYRITLRPVYNVRRDEIPTPMPSWNSKLIPIRKAMYKLHDKCEKKFGQKHQLLTYQKKVREDRKDYACDKCEKKFRIKSILLYHQNTVHEGHKYYACDNCDKKFGNQSNLTRHRKIVHEGRKDYACDNCEKKFGDKQQLFRHQKIVHENRKDYGCNKCQKKFALNTYLLRHQKTIHEGRKDNACDKCELKFGGKSALIRHQRSVHEGRKDFACDKCEKKFTEKKNLLFHLNTVHEGRKDYTCDKCEKKFGYKSDLLKHQRSVHEGRKDYACDKCEKKFGLNSYLRRHQMHNKIFHEVFKDYLCEICAKRFGHKCTLLWHIKTVHKCEKKFGQKHQLLTYQKKVREDRKDYACDKCEKKFRIKSILLFHQNTVHEGYKNYACDNCDKKFGIQSHLTRHRKMVHEGRKDYACDNCEKKFGEKSKLTRHQRTIHGDHKDHECDKCERKFGQKSDLIRHQKTVHEGRKDYACDNCEKKFGDKQQLLRHQKIVHENRKDYGCDRCEKKFGYKSDLLKHQRSVHEGRKDYACDKCEKKFGLNSYLRRHQMGVHKGYKIYVCVKCEKKFGDPSALIKHKKTVHEGCKDYACDKCEKKFGFKFNLLSHLKTVHENRKDYACDKCEKKFGHKKLLLYHQKTYIAVRATSILYGVYRALCIMQSRRTFGSRRVLTSARRDARESCVYQIKVKYSHDRSPLHIALDSDRKEVFELLLRGGASPNFANEDGTTPLFVMCEMEDDRDDLVKMLFEISDEKHLQVQVNVQDKFGCTPLHSAVANGNIEIAKLLLQRGADPNLANNARETALHLLDLVEDDDPDVVEMIFEACHDKHRPVQIDAQNLDGDTPLHLALIDSNEVVMKSLLKRGANPNLANIKGHTPLHVLCMDNYHDFNGAVKIYFDICDTYNRPVVVDAKDNEGLTPLQWAVANFLFVAVDAILDHGADLSNFVFPNESCFGKELEMISRDDCFITFVATKLRNATQLLPVINRLEKAGYELDRDDVLTVVKFFVKYEVFEKSRDLEEYNWFDDEEFLAMSRNIMVKPDLSFYDAMQLPSRQAETLLALTRYCEVANSFEGFRELPERQQMACVMHLCEKATKRFFQRWALDPFWKLIHYRLPIECCDMILDNLKNEDLCNIFLAG
ncbi:unnamed protein product, partial [Trichogramma brassicae]